MLFPKRLPLNDVRLQLFADQDSSPYENALQKQLTHKRFALTDHVGRVRDDGSLVTPSQDLPRYSVCEGLPSQAPVPSSPK